MEPWVILRYCRAFAFDQKQKIGYVLRFSLSDEKADFVVTYFRDSQLLIEPDRLKEKKINLFDRLVVDKNTVQYTIDPNSIPSENETKSSFQEDSRRFEWLQQLLFCPLDYLRMRNQALVFFAGIDEHVIFRRLFTIYHDQLASPDQIVKYKAKFQGSQTDLAGRSWDLAAPSACLDLEKVFLSPWNKLQKDIYQKKLVVAQKALKQIDTCHLIANEYKIRRSFYSGHELISSDKEPEEPTGASTEAIDFMSSLQLKTTIKTKPGIPDQPPLTMYNLKKILPPSSSSSDEPFSGE